MAAKHFLYGAVAVCIGLAAGVASAQDGGPSVANPYGYVDVAPGTPYFGVAGGASWLTLPGWEYGVEDDTNPVKPQVDIEADGWLYGGQAWLGLGIAEHTRIQLEGSYSEGEFEEHQFRPSLAGDNYVLLDASDQKNTAGDSETNLQVDVQGWEVGLRGLHDLVPNTAGALTPSLMFFGGAASQDYDASMNDFLPCPECFENFARQNVENWYAGVEAALAGTVNLTPALALTLGGRVAGLYFNADMDGEDCHDTDEHTAGCDAFFTSSVSDSLEELTYRGGGFAGLSFDFGPASVGVMGTVDYVPMADIVNPLFVGDEPSHLDLAHEVIYGVRGSLAIRLGSTNGMSH